MNLSNIYFLHEIGGKKKQEDYIWPSENSATPDDKIFIICDGVGGSENGELASKIVSEFVAATLQEIPTANLSTKTINDILLLAQQKLVSHAKLYALNTDMATTFTLLALNDDKAFVAWCGDSRVYHLRNGKVLYKTSDHSLVNTLVKKGEITEEEAQLHPQRNIILKAIKADNSPIEAEAHWITDINNGDYFMLCTDGLLENITDTDLTILLKQKDENNTDLISAFQQYCFNKTRDNYSMYLLHINKPHSHEYKKNKRWFLFVTSFILIAIGVVSGSYFYLKGQKDLNIKKVKMPGVMENTDSVTDHSPDPRNPNDSLPYFEIVNEGNNHDTSPPPNHTPAIFQSNKDTLENKVQSEDSTRHPLNQ